MNLEISEPLILGDPTVLSIRKWLDAEVKKVEAEGGGIVTLPKGRFTYEDRPPYYESDASEKQP